MFHLLLTLTGAACSLICAAYLIVDALTGTRFDGDRLDRWYDRLRPLLWPAFWIFLVADLVLVVDDGLGAVLRTLLYHGLLGVALWFASASDGGDDDGDEFDDDDDPVGPVGERRPLTVVG